MEYSYTETSITDIKETDFKFTDGDNIVENRNFKKRYIITKNFPTVFNKNVIKLVVMPIRQYQLKKELTYGIIRKQLLHYWRNSGFVGSIVTAILSAIFTAIALKLLDKFLGSIF